MRCSGKCVCVCGGVGGNKILFHIFYLKTKMIALLLRSTTFLYFKSSIQSGSVFIINNFIIN